MPSGTIRRRREGVPATKQIGEYLVVEDFREDPDKIDAGLRADWLPRARSADLGEFFRAQLFLAAHYRLILPLELKRLTPAKRRKVEEAKERKCATFIQG